MLAPQAVDPQAVARYGVEMGGAAEQRHLVAGLAEKTAEDGSQRAGTSDQDAHGDMSPCGCRRAAPRPAERGAAQARRVNPFPAAPAAGSCPTGSWGSRR